MHVPYNQRGLFWGLPLRVPRFFRWIAAKNMDGDLAANRSAYQPGLMADRRKRKEP